MKPSLCAMTSMSASNALDLLEADLMNLVRREIADGGAAADVVQVALLAAGQRGNAERGAAVGRIVRGDEGGEGPIGRQDFVGDRVR